MVFDGTNDRPATLGYVISSNIACGRQYKLKVTATNVAGESDGLVKSIKVGSPPSPPVYPRILRIVPLGEFKIAWNDSVSDGCLPVRHYIVRRDGADLASQVSPDSNVFADDLSSTADFPLGMILVYEVKAVNDAGESEYSEQLKVTVGQPPDAPTNVLVSRRYSETSVTIQWTRDTLIAGNPPTLAYRIYLDDLSGNVIVPSASVTPQFNITGLELGRSYKVTVSSFNQIGEGSQSTPALDLHTGVVPERLTGASAPVLSESSSTKITIKWLPPLYNGGA